MKTALRVALAMIMVVVIITDMLSWLTPLSGRFVLAILLIGLASSLVVGLLLSHRIEEFAGAERSRPCLAFSLRTALLLTLFAGVEIGLLVEILISEVPSSHVVVMFLVLPVLAYVVASVCGALSGSRADKDIEGSNGSCDPDNSHKKAGSSDNGRKLSGAGEARHEETEPKANE